MIFVVIFLGIVYLGCMLFLGNQIDKLLKSKIQKIIGFTVFLITYLLPIISIYDFMSRPNIAIISILSTIGFVTFVFYLYLLLLLVVFKVIRLFKILITKKDYTLAIKKIVFSSAILTSLLLCVLGVIGASTTSVTRINIEQTELRGLRIAAVSDLHYGSTGSILNMDDLVNDLNKQEADIIFLLGDVFDNRLKNLDINYFCNKMKEINSTYGTYAITGNHEFQYNDLEDVKKFYANSNIKLLLDEEVIIANRLRVIGRIDSAVNDENYRINISEIASSSKLPLLILDHKPNDYLDAKRVGAFLQLSGHTHNGQIFPGNIGVILNNKLFANNAPVNGLYKYDGYDVYVTRGYGNWGIPMRTTGNREVAILNF